MSGQPVKTKADQAKFLDEYMENLALQVQLDDENLQANKIYQRTGQLPPASSLPDNRTVEEKLKDVEGLKLGIIQDVSKIIDKSLAVSLVNEIQNSKYNVENSLLRFFAQRAPEFLKELEKRYKYGLKDLNDIISTVKFIERAYASSRESLSSIKDIFGRVETSNRGRDFDLLLELKQHLKDLGVLITSKAMSNYNIHIEDINDVIKILTSMSLALPSRSEFENWYKDINFALAQLATNPLNPNRPFVMELLQQIRNMENYINETIPEDNFIRTMNSEISRVVNMSAPPTEKNRLIQEYFSALIKELNKGNIRSLKDIRDLKLIINQQINDLQRMFGLQAPGIPGRPAIPYQPAIPPAPGVPGVPAVPAQPAVPAVPAQQMDIAQQIERGTQPSRNLSPADKLTMMQNSYIFLYNYYQPEFGPLGLPIDPPGAIMGMTNNELRTAFDNMLNLLDQNDIVKRDFIEQGDPLLATVIIGGRIAGGGLRKPKISRPFSTRIDTTAGIQATPDFVGFGVYLINRKRLNDGIVSLKTNKGSNIRGYPNRRVSLNLSGVLRKIIGGSMPSYEDLSKLDDDEKTYLHQISKKANILDKLSIPTPSKDETEKDLHSFEVMKGEIMSGNDNKDLIKKFKLLVLKLKMKGYLPKSQAEEILTDLSSLGY